LPHPIPTKEDRSGTNKLLGLAKIEELKQVRDKGFNQKFNSTKEATSPLRIHKGRAITKSIMAHPIPTKEGWWSLRTLHKGEGKYKRSWVLHTKRALNRQRLTV
jgi:hypothetical protein